MSKEIEEKIRPATAGPKMNVGNPDSPVPAVLNRHNIVHAPKSQTARPAAEWHAPLVEVGQQVKCRRTTHNNFMEMTLNRLAISNIFLRFLRLVRGFTSIFVIENSAASHRTCSGWNAKSHCFSD